MPSPTFTDGLDAIIADPDKCSDGDVIYISPEDWAMWLTIESKGECALPTGACIEYGGHKIGVGLGLKLGQIVVEEPDDDDDDEQPDDE